MVQINVEVKTQPGDRPRLNIVDILKPAEEVVEMQPGESLQRARLLPSRHGQCAVSESTKMFIRELHLIAP